jgi:hypothetical protein
MAMPRQAQLLSTAWLITLGAMLAIAVVVASQRRRTRVPLSDAKRKLYKRLVEVALALFLAAIGLSPAPAIEGGQGAVADGLEDFLKAAKCEDWLVRAATWCKENGAETLDELLQCQPSTHAMFVDALNLPVVKREQLERQLAKRLREQSSSADDHSTIPKSAAVNTPAAEAASTAIANKFLPDLPTFVFGDRTLYEDGILARVGNLSRSVQEEFEENERGFWLPELRYVTEQPAIEAYPSTKGVAPSDALVPSYTRDLGRAGWVLSKFHEAQPTEGNGPGQIPERLSLAETAVLRTYTGPWFQAINFYLRYLPEVRCCDASPYNEHYDPRRCFLAKPGHEDVCHACNKPKSKHFIQTLDSWATSAALLVGGILKLRFASTPMTVYRGVKEPFIRLPESFIESRGGGVELAPMSTTEAKEVAQSYAGDDVGSLFQIEFDAVSRGAHLGFLSQYPKEEELVYPPGTMLTCMAVEPLEGQASKRLLRISCSINPDTKVKDAITKMNTHHDMPQGALPRMYMLVVLQTPPVLFNHVRSHLSPLQQLASTALADQCAQWLAKGKATICLRDADPSAVRRSLMRSQTHCLVWHGLGYDVAPSTCSGSLTIMTLAAEISELRKVCRPRVALVALQHGAKRAAKLLFDHGVGCVFWVRTTNEPPRLHELLSIVVDPILEYVCLGVLGEKLMKRFGEARMKLSSHITDGGCIGSPTSVDWPKSTASTSPSWIQSETPELRPSNLVDEKTHELCESLSSLQLLACDVPKVAELRKILVARRERGVAVWGGSGAATDENLAHRCRSIALEATMSLLIGTTFELVWRISDEQSLNEGMRRIKAAGPRVAVLVWIDLVESLPLVQLSTLLKPILARAREAACAVVLSCLGTHAQQMQALDEELGLGVSSSIAED